MVGGVDAEGVDWVCIFEGAEEESGMRMGFVRVVILIDALYFIWTWYIELDHNIGDSKSSFSVL